jgi:hypothetical protein
VANRLQCLQESDCLGLQSKKGGRLHLRLNISKRPIANKYREGKMKSTLKREFKVREIAERETFGTIVAGSVLRHMPAGQRQFVLGNGFWSKGAKQLALQLTGKKWPRTD